MARIATTSTIGETIMDRLRRAYTVNLENSERLIAYARKAGDSELLIRAEADLTKWKMKLAEMPKQG
jgi:hypothetical protein